jgi:hypothetical protein
MVEAPDFINAARRIPTRIPLVHMAAGDPFQIRRLECFAFHAVGRHRNRRWISDAGADGVRNSRDF